MGGLFLSEKSTENQTLTIFLAGIAVQMAGMLKIDNAGNLVNITNGSGHYLPNNRHMAKFLEWLHNQKADLKKIKLFMYNFHRDRYEYYDPESFLKKIEHNKKIARST